MHSFAQVPTKPVFLLSFILGGELVLPIITVDSLDPLSIVTRYPRYSLRPRPIAPSSPRSRPPKSLSPCPASPPVCWTRRTAKSPWRSRPMARARWLSLTMRTTIKTPPLSLTGPYSPLPPQLGTPEATGPSPVCPESHRPPLSFTPTAPPVSRLKPGINSGPKHPRG